MGCHVFDAFAGTAGIRLVSYTLLTVLRSQHLCIRPTRDITSTVLHRITVSPEGNMTLMTTAQIGDWDHDTTGAPKDLFVTGDVHIGKSNGSLFVNGDIDVSIFYTSHSA